jgi:CBS domain-containing protein
MIHFMKVQDIMTKEVHTCLPDTDLGMAAMQMWEGDFGVLPVVSPEGEPVGMITDRDICMGAASRNEAPGSIRVEDVMSGEVYSCAPDAEIHKALETMQQRRVRRMPVVEKGKVVGLLSLNQIALKAQRDPTSELSAQDVEETLREISAHSTFALGRPLRFFGKMAPAAA